MTRQETTVHSWIILLHLLYTPELSLKNHLWRFFEVIVHDLIQKWDTTTEKKDDFVKYWIWNFEIFWYILCASTLKSLLVDEDQALPFHRPSSIISLTYYLYILYIFNKYLVLNAGRMVKRKFSKLEITCEMNVFIFLAPALYLST